MRKPRPSDWLFCLLLIPVGVFFSNLSHYNSFLSTMGVGGGIGGLIGLGLRLRRYRALSPEEQREADRQDRDERNLTIRGRAATITVNTTMLALVAGIAVFEVLDSDIGSKLCAGLFLLMMLINAIAAYVLDRRM